MDKEQEAQFLDSPHEKQRQQKMRIRANKAEVDKEFAEHFADMKKERPEMPRSWIKGEVAKHFREHHTMPEGISILTRKERRARR